MSRLSLHAAEWQLLQSVCEDLVKHRGIVWAGVGDGQAEPRWFAAAGDDAFIPAGIDDDQRFVQLERRAVEGIALLKTVPARAGRDFCCGVVVPASVCVVVVPDRNVLPPGVYPFDSLEAALVKLRQRLPTAPRPLALPPYWLVKGN